MLFCLLLFQVNLVHRLVHAAARSAPRRAGASGSDVPREKGCLVEECRGLQRDAIALPGGRHGAERLRDSAALKELLLAQSAAGKLTAAVCASRVTAIQTPRRSLMARVGLASTPRSILSTFTSTRANTSSPTFTSSVHAHACMSVHVHVHVHAHVFAHVHERPHYKPTFSPI